MINIAPKATLNEHKDTGTGQELQEPEKDTLDPTKFLTPEELEIGKLPPEEILSLPMFKNYSAGNPASVLYIKNLAKDVIPDDFYLLFDALRQYLFLPFCSCDNQIMPSIVNCTRLPCSYCQSFSNNTKSANTINLLHTPSTTCTSTGDIFAFFVMTWEFELVILAIIY
ncbi:U11/U12 small nuclear ribonucleoprotein 65 kDa protein [Trifolium repens]|nr:U11/U12 small nuclear ribonucleoprotein 65 kDa protein [Trifolium repens]